MDNIDFESMSNKELQNLLTKLCNEMEKRNLIKTEMSEPQVTVSGGFGYPVLGGEVIGPSMWSKDN